MMHGSASATSAQIKEQGPSSAGLCTDAIAVNVGKGSQQQSSPCATDTSSSNSRSQVKQAQIQRPTVGSSSALAGQRQGESVSEFTSGKKQLQRTRASATHFAGDLGCSASTPSAADAMRTSGTRGVKPSSSDAKPSSSEAAPARSCDDASSVPLRAAVLSGRSLRRARLMANLMYLFALWATCTASGGVLLGIGAFAQRLQDEDLLSSEQLNVVFDGSFQMLTWGSLFWSLYHDHMGPRCCAVLGMLLATAGNVLVAAAVNANSKDEYEYTLGLGLMAAGGNGAFISSFQFTALFDANQGIRVSILSAGFNVAAYVYLFLNSSVSLFWFFVVSAAYTLSLAAVMAVIYPDTPYVPGSHFGLTRPRCCHCGVEGCGSFCMHTPLVSSISVTACGSDACATAERAAAERAAAERAAAVAADKRAPNLSTFGALKRQLLPSELGFAGQYLREGRFWGFCLAFSWASLVQQWAFGSIPLILPDASAEYLSLAFPCIANATFLFSPFIGRLIDRTGFRLPGLLLILSMEVSIGSLWIGGDVARWVALVSLCVLAALTFTLQFAYLAMAFPPKAYPGLLAVTLVVQGSFGFISWPLLSEVQIFGPDPSLGNFLLMLLPSFPLYLWPLWLQPPNDAQLCEKGIVGRGRSTITITVRRTASIAGAPSRLLET